MTDNSFQYFGHTIHNFAEFRAVKNRNRAAGHEDRVFTEHAPAMYRRSQERLDFWQYMKYRGSDSPEERKEVFAHHVEQATKEMTD